MVGVFCCTVKTSKMSLFIVENTWCEGWGVQSSVNIFGLDLLLLIKKAIGNRIGRGFERSSSLSPCPSHFQLHLLCLCQYFDWGLGNLFQCFPILNRLAQIFHAEVEFIASYSPWAWKTDYFFPCSSCSDIWKLLQCASLVIISLSGYPLSILSTLVCHGS